MVPKKKTFRAIIATSLPLLIMGCGMGFAGQGGPSAGAVNSAAEKASIEGIQVVELSPDLVRSIANRQEQKSFAASLGGAEPAGTVVQQGDALEVSVWEAPPAVLFGGGASASRLTEGQTLSASTTMPETLVGKSGVVFVPFAGTIQVVGRTTHDIEADITNRLAGKAHLPQVVVRITRNASTTVTVVGEVSNSARLPLTPKGERVLDALAQVGGTRQQSNKITIQITRGSRVVAMPLDTVIRDPKQNIILASGDVITALYQPFSFTVLGAAGRNDEINFEGTGISLAQALGRIGGLQDQRANAKGLFIFRWEDRDAAHNAENSLVTQDGRVPVIYRVDMRNPGALFLAQDFQMKNRDVVYVATAPIAEFQQFVNIIASTVLPLVAVKNSVN